MSYHDLLTLCFVVTRDQHSTMSERTENQNSSSHDVGQFGREDSIVSGCRSTPDTTKTLHRLHTSSAQFNNTASVSTRCDTSEQSVAEGGRHASQSTRSSQRPPSSSGQQPPTAPGRRRRAVRHNVSESYVDESLFGPVTDDTFATSWQPKQRSVKPFIFDCTDYKAKASTAGSSTKVPSSRPPSQRSARSRPQSARLHSQPSFVDESLFGDQLEQSSWRAPWDKKDCRPKPLIFDAYNYGETQRRQSISEGRLQQTSSINRGPTKHMPPWR